jgi:hypothetical protein
MTTLAATAMAWLVTTSVLASVSAPAEASDAAPTIAEPSLRAPQPSLPRYSLTFSPLYLAVPMGEVSAEMRVRDKLGVSALAGLGWVTFTSPPLKTHLIIYELGTQGRYYVLGNFRHGMVLGGEVAYIHLSSPFEDQVQLSSDALSLAPFVGYKYTMKVGFTVEAEVGYDFLLARGTLDSETNRATTSVVLFDVRIGWSF